MNTVKQPMYEWKTLPWKKIERQVFKLQKRIYQASHRGDTPTVHKLQRLLLTSWAAKCLAVRRVTQDNRGKKTAGVDGVKNLTPPQRLKLVHTLSLPQTAQPTRRVWIDKPGKTEKRPLGIPTLRNRAEQALAKLALEPEWEARFEPNSYGFRPGRCVHDAIEAIVSNTCHQAKYVLDADIAKCFDRINHTALLAKLHTFSTLRRAIRAWLKAGVVDKKELFPTEAGTPQGGVISPLLANIALHGLETAVITTHPKARIVRYADDLVVFHPELTDIHAIQQTVSDWLAGMGLELKPSKTRITHTLETQEGQVGFDFLGFHVRQYRVGKTHSAKSTGRYPKLLGYKTLTRPSTEAIHQHYQKLKEIIDTHRATSQSRLIGQLNPIIKGWTTYYATAASKNTFTKVAYWLFLKLKRWAIGRHRNKSWYWIARNYWHPQQGKWSFAPSDGTPLYTHPQTPIKRHVKVQSHKSPYDGDWVYWVKRRGKQPGVSKRVTVLLNRQKGKCTHCGLYFKPEDKLEVDHLIPKSRGGKDSYSNWQLLHAHCHHRKSAEEEKLRRLEAQMKAANRARSRMRANPHVRF